MTDGAVVISLDTELAWGFHGTGGGDHLSDDGMREREAVNRLLALFEQHGTPVTWAVVGHLFLSSCDGAHDDLQTADYDFLKGEWFDEDPGTSSDQDPMYYAPDISDSIVQSEVDHEVGVHTFSHVLCGPDECTSDVLRDELAACRAAVPDEVEDIDSLVYPSNEIAHRSVLPDEGISIYRGVSAENAMRETKSLGRYRKFARYLRRVAPPIVRPKRVRSGLWELPASQYLPYEPLPRLSDIYPIAPRVRRAQNAIDRARDEDAIFHLWAHPHNFDEAMFEDLSKIVKYAVERDVPFFTMRQAVSKFGEVLDR